MKNIIIVGAGGSGAILGRQIAEKLDTPVRIIERRNHVAGNMYDEWDERGFLVQKYGPHHFYTNNYHTYHFFEQYAEFFMHYYKSKNYIDGQYLSMPMNFYTVQELMGREKAAPLLVKLRKEFAERERVPIYELVEHADKDISEYGNLIFDKAYKTYISKMWDIPIEKIDKYVLERRSMSMNYDERVADYDFQGLPKEGFTKLFENMLSHKNISIHLNTNALDHISFCDNQVYYDGQCVDCLIYTGNIDELFSYKFGKLPYRSLDIQFEYHDEESVLPTEGVSYPQAKGYVRKIEFRKMMYDTSRIKVRGSILSVEYPMEYNKDAKKGNIPYYPVVTEDSQAIYNQYVEEAKKYGNIFLCGRLAEFRYIDMHTCVEHALEYFENIKSYLI